MNFYLHFQLMSAKMPRPVEFFLERIMMKKNVFIFFMAILFTVGMTTGARAAPIIDLFDWGYNIDGTTYLSPDFYSGPSAGQLAGTGIDDGGFSYSSSKGSGGGLGSISVSISSPGTH